MKRLTVFLLGVCFVFSLTACGGQQNALFASWPQQSNNKDVSQQNNNLEEFPSSADSISDDSNILIAYFTWAENTQVENPETIDVDASTLASVLLPGNAAMIAGWIQERTGGDLFSIVVTEPYSSDYDECLERAADEKAENARPELINHVENMENYDIVFLGFPNWWYTAPMAIHSFLEEYDFSGKTVIPFVTHGTSGLASIVEDVTANLPDSTTILEPIGVYHPEVAASQPAINEWLDNLGFNKTEIETASENIDSVEKTLRMVVEGQEVIITLYDTPAANALYEMLPLELNFEDFNKVEKISYLPEELPTEGEPDGCDPDAGDLCLYAPWGNLSIFYEDFRQSNGLIPLGHIESGIETISNMDSDFSVTLEALE